MVQSNDQVSNGDIDTNTIKVININKWLNHKSFGNTEDCQKVNGENIGVFNTLLNYKSIKLLEGINPDLFKLSNKNGNDNINCRIKINIDVDIKCNEIYFLSFSEWTEFSEEICITYQDGTKTKKPFFIPEFCQYDVDKNGYLNGIWTNSWHKERKLVPYFLINRLEGHRGHFYIISVKVSEQTKHIINILLPINELIHIYSISYSCL
jgi:hypothetical protein